MRNKTLTTVCVLMFTAYLLQACGTSQPTKYYLLSSEGPVNGAASMQEDLVIGIGPIVLPEYLDRRQIVTRTKANELKVSTFHQWGEPLGQNLSRVVRENMSEMIPTDRIILLPVKRSIRKALTLDYQVTIAISKFERDTNGEVVLNARWALLNNDKEELTLRRSVYQDMPKSSDYADLAASQSQLLIQLSRDIAETIRQFEAKQ